MLTTGQRWREARESAGLSAIDAANLAGVHRNTIYDLEKNDEGVTLRVMSRVASIYGVTLGTIFCDPSAATIPSELRPLQELLQPLDAETRLSFVRNVVANARFMAQIIAIRDVDQQTLLTDKPYNPRPTNSESDGGEDAVYAVGAGSVRKESNGIPRTTPREAGSERVETKKGQSKR